jgi:dUTP pyrophosphatase
VILVPWNAVNTFKQELTLLMFNRIFIYVSCPADTLCKSFSRDAKFLFPRIPIKTRSILQLTRLLTTERHYFLHQRYSRTCNNMTQQPLFVQYLTESAKAPTRGSQLAAGYDLYSSEEKVIKAGERALVSTGLAIAVPEGTYGRVAPRSGLAVKHGLDCGAGVIDADYRGEVRVLLFNLSKDDYEVKTGDRIAQLVLEKIVNPPVEVVTSLTETDRGAKGFGSTGKN